MTQTAKQFLVTAVFDLRALLKPYNGDTVDGLQLGRFVHAFEYDLRSVGEFDSHGRSSVCNLLLAPASQLQILKNLNQQVKAGVSDCVKDLANNQHFAFLFTALQNYLQCNVIRFGGAIPANKEVLLVVPVEEEIFKPRVDLLVYHGHVTSLPPLSVSHGHALLPSWHCSKYS